MTNYILINQKFFAENDALISVKERAARFGDGIFETCKIIDGKIYDFNAHLSRLKRGLAALQINFDTKNIKKDSYHLIEKNQSKNGILRISISRGSGSMGYLPKAGIKPLLIIEAMNNAHYPQGEIVIGISKIKAPKRARVLQKCKTMQGLNYVLCKINAKKSAHFDDIMLSEEGFISECSSTNIFWVKKGKIYTSANSCDLLCGLVRQKIIDKFHKKINLVKARPSTLYDADEIFLTNSNFLVLAVDKLVVKNKIINFKKDISTQILQWLQAKF